jgi:hypothetical protein
MQTTNLRFKVQFEPFAPEGRCNMGTWRRTLARSAWTAFLVLFAARAIAGTAVCGFYGGFGVTTGAAHANELRSHAAQSTHEHASPAQPQSHDGEEIACEEPVYLSGKPLLRSTTNCSLSIDAISWSYAPAHGCRTTLSEKSVLPRQSAQPPPTVSPLDLSPRLRI